MFNKTINHAPDTFVAGTYIRMYARKRSHMRYIRRTLPLPVVDTTNKTIVAVINRCVGEALSHTTQERSFILFYIGGGEESLGIQKPLASGRIYCGSKHRALQDQGLTRKWVFG